MNESMNHEAVYRAAPATPGLLKSLPSIIYEFRHKALFNKKILLLIIIG